MRTLLGQFGLRFTTGHLIWAAVLIPACLAVCVPHDLLWVGVGVSVVIVIGGLLCFAYW